MLRALAEVSQVRCRMIPGPAADAALSDLGARVVTEGMNLAVIEVKSPGEMLFREHLHGAWLANPIQVYLDLFRSEGRLGRWLTICAKQRSTSNDQADHPRRIHRRLYSRLRETRSTYCAGALPRTRRLRVIARMDRLPWPSSNSGMANKTFRYAKLEYCGSARLLS